LKFPCAFNATVSNNVKTNLSLIIILKILIANIILIIEKLISNNL